MSARFFKKSLCLSVREELKQKKVIKRVLLLYRQQQYQASVPHFKKALDLDAQHPEAKSYLIRVQSVMGLDSQSGLGKSQLIEDRVRVRRQEQSMDLKYKLDQADSSYDALKSKELFGQWFAA